MTKKGLSRTHHEELNAVLGVPPGRHDELRAEYADDCVAQQQIDAHDGSSQYSRRFGEYIDAHREGNAHKQSVLRRWFKVFFPDM